MSTLGFRHDLVPMGSGHHEAGVGCCARGSASSAGMVWWISAQNQMGNNEAATFKDEEEA
ncbi:hypothetical protein ACHAPF_009426 [Botrytis cinerea]|uniref:Uncharacterized protein n=1 Tax=Botryotinia fuckeliana (strain T4) TaxID=999810 RepID=G2YGZ8_BOTF4|nr:hypothetical protein BofuT4_uP023000.1 [Botrytis cinerea T4]